MSRKLWSRHNSAITPVLIALSAALALAAVASSADSAAGAGSGAAAANSALAVTPSVKQGGQMVSTVALSKTNVWSVGGTDQPGQSNGKTLIRHWNGKAWTRVSSPNLAVAVNSLNSVSAVSATNIWASGNAADTEGDVFNIMEHWNGHKWAMVTAPDNPASSVNYLQAVSADSATDAWAAADYVNADGVWIPYAEHWNGHKWAIVDVPTPTGSLQTFLTGVLSVSSDNAWLIGQCIDSAGVPVTLAEHWNGSKWSVVSTPNPQGAEASGLSGISAASSTDVWAVGNSVTDSGDTPTLVEHWNGSKWNIVKSPDPKGGTGGDLNAVSADSTDDVWAAGEAPTSSGGEDTLIEHWNGHAWAVVKSPDGTGAEASVLNGVSATRSSNAWATGSQYTAAGKAQPLDLRWNGKKWQIED